MSSGVSDCELGSGVSLVASLVCMVGFEARS